MTPHAFKAYLRYRWKAKSRHGIHSPFVYSFIENGLMQWNNKELLPEVSAYFHSHTVRVCDIKDMRYCRQAIAEAQDHTLIVFHAIHEDHTSSENWETLIRSEDVRLSIDLYSLGLLFFNKDVKERQHFVLKYPL